MIKIFKKVTVLFLLIFTVTSFGQYKMPSKDIVDVFDAEPIKYMSIISGTEFAVEFTYMIHPSLDKLSREYLSLAGKKIDPILCTVKESYPYTKLQYYNLKTKKRFAISDENDSYIYSYKISYDKKNIAYLVEAKEGLILKIKDLKNGNLVYKSSFFINNTMEGVAYNWSSDNRTIIAASILNSRKGRPQRDIALTSPIIKESTGKMAKARTYQNLLNDNFDIDQFDYFFTSQMVKVDIFDKSIKDIYKPGIFRDFSISPDAKYFLVKEVLKPYSFSLPYYRFPYRSLVLDNSGQKIKDLIQKKLQNEIPTWGTEIGMRYPFFASNSDAVLIWAEAQDDGDPIKKVPFRDFLYKMDLNKNEEPVLFAKLKERFNGIEFFKQEGLCLISENNYDKEWLTSYIISFLDLSYKKRVIESRSENDKYSNPGALVTKTTLNGKRFILQKDNFVYYMGTGATKKGNLPFLDKVNFTDWKKKRVFQSNSNEYARFKTFYNGDFKQIVVVSETKNDPPNYFIQNLQTNKRTKVSNNIDSAPQLRQIKKEIITYYRADSLLLSGTLYYPKGYVKGKRYPLLIRAYPREFKDAKTASQISGSENKFTRLWGSSPLYLTLSGYFVLNNATMPVIGDVIERNNSFVKQIVSSAKAAIDYLDKKKLIQRENVAVVGHSYGAFMTANLLAHSNLFKAGIARSGAYNRTLTPFGFQSERRSFWEAKDFYLSVSPFVYADKIKTPLLLIHGEKDSNSGTFTMQSKRFYDAIKGNGGTVRLCLLPYEEHGYVARKSGLHVLYEMERWLDLYLK